MMIKWEQLRALLTDVAAESRQALLSSLGKGLSIQEGHHFSPMLDPLAFLIDFTVTDVSCQWHSAMCSLSWAQRQIKSNLSLTLTPQ